MGPKSVRVRMYQVGFGDCFLLTFTYHGKAKPRHVLVDFGSTAAPSGDPGSLLPKIAQDIQRTVGTDPFAVVATHRHRDHISGFDPGSNGKGPGAIIAALKPRWVIQPWTEQPDLPVDAEAPSSLKGLAARKETLASMQAIAKQAVEEALPRLQRGFQHTEAARQLAFIGEDNIANPGAVRNLMRMGSNDYVYAGKRTKLSSFLPGVKVSVLGPPTVKQHASIRKQRSGDPDEFWSLQAKTLGVGLPKTGASAGELFAGFAQATGGQSPPWARWIIKSLRSARGDELLQLIRSLDSAMNNTSVILLFEFGGHRFLFPGDAQIENWEYALGQAKYKKLLKGVTVYKVGHHGSLNATPRTLWNGWYPKGAKPLPAKQRMTSFMSTKAGKHGSAAKGTEVPRTTLVTALEGWTRLHSTQHLAGALYVEELFGGA
ncbi:MAG: hypothetical protein J0H27_03825 [Xanthomonadales bacterium]|nr:hypothetical protein [Xanthomonadales bacterium]ODU93427.1 MAG: hypothetical protein ABT18_08610 [Rhodanobacter sp. SCN 66-43]OJY83185.1 MAG: hypothetical protein BGP23_09125 [Xanthomonadales bacterium 66-474]